MWAIQKTSENLKDVKQYIDSAENGMRIEDKSERYERMVLSCLAEIAYNLAEISDAVREAKYNETELL